MSRKLKVIVSSLAVVIIVCLISTIYPATSSFAYSGGLLNGKSLTIGNDLNHVISTTSAITDDVESTGTTIHSTGKDGDYIWFKFDNPVNIKYFYMINADKSTIPVRVFDSTMKRIDSWNVTGDGVIRSFNGTTVMKNVSYIGIENVKANENYISEFDVFDESFVIPTPTPSATPEPTVEPTAEPTQTATPEPTPEIPSGDRAILTIELTTGADEEFDLPMSEVNAFLSWYDSSSGSARYGIDKHDNNKGPFSKRTEYVIHDKILSFEVSEYTAAE